MEETTQTENVPPRSEATGATQAIEGTDLHTSKISPDDPRLRVDRPRLRTLRRGPALAVALGIGLVIAVALVVALGGPSNDQSAKKESREPDPAATAPVPLPEVLKDKPDRAASASAAPPIGTGGSRGGGAAPPAAPATDQRAEALRRAREDELMRARGATLFAGVDEGAASAQQQTDLPRRGDAGKEGDSSTGPRSSAVVEPGGARDPNLQERKNDFLAKASVSSAEYLEKGLTLPRSPYEVKAGTVIPTVLISGINSDLPGQVVAQVRENVYDTVSGNYLLVPQGSRLLAAYDSMVAWGQERVLVCWNRLIRPDGSSIALDCMPGVDLAGYAGFADEVDNHWWRIITGAVFSSVLAATAQRSQGDVGGYQPTFPQVWASNAAGQINQSGQQITQKNLQLQPTITVRPGFSVNVLVTKDIVITPYSRQGAMP
jgi:type IV secretion system protein VirB10